MANKRRQVGSAGGASFCRNNVFVPTNADQVFMGFTNVYIDVSSNRHHLVRAAVVVSINMFIRLRRGPELDVRQWFGNDISGWEHCVRRCDLPDGPCLREHSGGSWSQCAFATGIVSFVCVCCLTVSVTMIITNAAWLHVSVICLKSK